MIPSTGFTNYDGRLQCIYVIQAPNTKATSPMRELNYRGNRILLKSRMVKENESKRRAIQRCKKVKSDADSVKEGPKHAKGIRLNSDSSSQRKRGDVIPSAVDRVVETVREKKRQPCCS